MNKILLSLLMFTTNAIYPMSPQSTSSSVVVSACIDCGTCMIAEHACKYRCHACTIKKHEIKARQKEYDQKEALCYVISGLTIFTTAALILKNAISITTSPEERTIGYATACILVSTFMGGMYKAKKDYDHNNKKAAYHREQAKKLQNLVIK